ncbi:MAG: OmpA family protein [Flavobacteriales bacterium]|nr:OmpA family protein [Flavobacteriales bacterium]MBP9078855.1 OmpA family protein [Flavobacteriales bacterium]
MRACNHPIPLALLAAMALASCADHHVRKGSQAMGLLAYSKAEHHFDKALKHRQDRDLLILAAKAEAKQNKVEEAAAHYGAAEQLAPLNGADAYQYGRLLMNLGSYHEAESLLVRAWQDQPERRDITELIGSTQGYKSFYSDSSRYAVDSLVLEGVATAFSAVPDGQAILFTGQRGALANKQDPWSGYSFTDLYRAEITNAPPGATQLLKGQVNGPYHEGPAVLANGGKTLYFTRSNYYGRKLIKDEKNISNLKLFRATLQQDGTWGEISEFSYNSDAFSVGQPALGNDGKTLYFTSDRPGGLGGKDLWYCRDLGTGWEAPVNMGPTINTSGDEMFPTVVGDALYFSSTNHNNMGGLDILETHKEGEHWSEPRNMGYPVNTTRDDFGLWLDSTGTRGYLSSNRSGTDWTYALRVNPPVFALEGTVTLADGDRPVPAARITLENLTDHLLEQGTADDSGRFSFTLKPNTTYAITATKEGLLTRSTTASTVGLAMSTTLRVDIGMKPLELDKPFPVPNIYYDYDKWDIRPDAAAELDKLVVVFTDNPELTFELGSHTDSRGGDLYNLVLSDARAKSAVDYLVRKGVDPDRLLAKGYGETELVNRCGDGVKCTEDEHQANRRTEFRVVRAGR